MKRLGLKLELQFIQSVVLNSVLKEFLLKRELHWSLQETILS